MATEVRTECPVCERKVLRTHAGEVVFHYTWPGIGLPCTGKQEVVPE